MATNKKQISQDLLRAIPNVEKCLQKLFAQPEVEEVPVVVVKNCVRDVLAGLRQVIRSGKQVSAASLKLKALLPVFLERIKKGMSVEQVLAGMEKAKAAGIRMLLSFILGLGGRERSQVAFSPYSTG